MYFIKYKGKEYYVNATVHPKKLITHINNVKKLYDHDKLWDALNDLSEYLDSEQIKVLQENIFANYKNQNITIPFGKIEDNSDKDDGVEQLSLF